jgi:hypothetical protein
VQFIIEQQAKFAVDIDELRRSQAETDGRICTLVDVNLSLVNHIGEIDRRLEQFILVTDQRLNALIETLHRHIRWHAEHNGGSRT